MDLDVRDKAAVEKRLWDDVDKNRFGMLGIIDYRTRHFAPMTAFVEPESASIWFFTNKDSDLARASQSATPAMFIVMAKDRELQACISGELRATTDGLHRDKYWGPMVAAWFPQGKTDPSLTLLHLKCTEADVWISEQGPLKFGWEMAKANLTGAVPDVGDRVSLTLS